MRRLEPLLLLIAASLPAQSPAPLPVESARNAQISQLTLQALQTSDPKAQIKLYEKILELDPNNTNAVEGIKEAQQKIADAAAQQQKAAAQQAVESDLEKRKAAAVAQALQSGEAAFLRDDLGAAQAQVQTAYKIAPANAQVQLFRQRVEDAVAARNRQRFLEVAGVSIAVAAALMAFLLTRGKKDPYLEVVDGFAKGKRFPLDEPIVHIGAVAQDGGKKNEIVLQDVERMISRFHCEIHNQAGRLFLIDCQSANGTRLDRHAIVPGKPVRLKNGSRVELGGTCALRLGFEKKKKKS